MWSIRTIDEDIDVYRMYGNDHDVRKLAEYVTLRKKMIEVYIEHERATLYTYYMTHEDADFSTPKCVIQEIEDDVMPEMQATKLKPRKPVKGQPDKKLMLEWIGDPNVGVVDHGQASQGTKEIADNDFDPFLDLDSLDVVDWEIPQSIGKGKGVLETFEEDEIARGGGNENKTNNVTDVEEGSDSGQGSDSESSDGNDSDELVDDENPVEHVHFDMDTLDKSNADTLGVEDRHDEFNANEEIYVDLDVIDNEEFESALDEDGLDRVRQRKLKL
ncbi:hypothetical protein Tco_0111389 [Tanacetum coccineum]